MAGEFGKLPAKSLFRHLLRDNQEQRVVRRFEDADPVVQRLIDPSYRGVSGASCSRSTVRCL